MSTPVDMCMWQGKDEFKPMFIQITPLSSKYGLFLT